MHCKHCEAPFVLGKCRDCGLMIQDQCADCHNELAHGKVKQRTKHASSKANSRPSKLRVQPHLMVSRIGTTFRRLTSK